MVLFTTGRGTPYGGFVPTMKISTNTALAEKKPNWIDFNAGRLVTDKMTMNELLVELIDYVVDVANGTNTNNEKNNFREIAIFKSGVTVNNPILGLVLGLCPALAVSTTVLNAIGMGAAATFVLLGSNTIISSIKQGILIYS